MTEQEWLTSEDHGEMARLLLSVRADLSGTFWPGDRKMRLWVEACREMWPKWEGEGDLANRETLMTAVRLLSSRWAGMEHARHICDLLRDIVGNPFRLAKRHNLYRTGDPDAPSCVKDGNGDVVLGLCRDCGRGESELSGPCRWLTPTVLSLAKAAYDERPDAECEECNGYGGFDWYPEDDPSNSRLEGPVWMNCRAGCKGGRTTDGRLDHVRLAVLADAMEEAGCGGDVVAHLRRPANCDACGGTGIGTDEYSGTVEVPGQCPRCGGQVGPHYRGCWALDLILGKE